MAGKTKEEVEAEFNAKASKSGNPTGSGFDGAPPLESTTKNGFEESGGILTAAEIETIRGEAKKKINDELRKDARKKALDRFMVEERIALGQLPEAALQEDVHVYVELAEHSAYISLDMRQYWHGHTYVVSPGVADTLYEMMDRGHKHQAEIDGKSRFKPTVRDQILSGRTGAVTTRASLAQSLMGRAI